MVQYQVMEQVIKSVKMEMDMRWSRKEKEKVLMRLSSAIR
jgi:hypothetical protein